MLDGGEGMAVVDEAMAEDAMLHLSDEAAIGRQASPNAMQLVTGGGAAASHGLPRASRATTTDHSHQMLPTMSTNALAANSATANILGALAHSPASSTALQLASVLARMPPLPPSTAQLPPRGTVQREHIEAAVELAFRQLSITASQGLASGQQQR